MPSPGLAEKRKKSPSRWKGSAEAGTEKAHAVVKEFGLVLKDMGNH